VGKSAERNFDRKLKCAGSKGELSGKTQLTGVDCQRKKKVLTKRGMDRGGGQAKKNETYPERGQVVGGRCISGERDLVLVGMRHSRRIDQEKNAWKEVGGGTKGQTVQSTHHNKREKGGE